MTTKKHKRVTSPTPSRARELLSAFCCTEKELEKLPGYALTYWQLSSRHNLDMQNNLLARCLAVYLLHGEILSQYPGTERKRWDCNLGAFDELVCELFALGFTRYDFSHTIANRTIEALESGDRWTAFDTQLDQRLGFRTAAEVRVSILRKDFLTRIKDQEAGKLAA